MFPDNHSITAIDHEITDSEAWCRQDTVWMLSLYGTAIGAGTLFLPINAGISGIWPLLIMAVIAFPMTYFSHRALCRFVLSGSGKNDITDVVDEHFGSKAGQLITWLYFFAIYPILLMYSVAITNTTNSFLVNQLGIPAPPRALLSIALILGLMAIVHYGQELIVKSMSMLVYPFVIILMLLALYLIPYWNTAIFHQPLVAGTPGTHHGLLMTLWLLVPVMVFSFNHSPIISSFAVDQKVRYGHLADRKSTSIMKYSQIMMVGTVMFFVFSCVFSLSPADLVIAKQQNISILSYLANHFRTPVIAYVAPFIAFIAIAKSFLGHYLGAREGLHGLLAKSLQRRKKTSLVSGKLLHHLIEVFIIITCWIIATVNPGILSMIEVLGGPVIAIILFLMPMYAIARVPALQKYRGLRGNVFVLFMGIIALSATLYGLAG
ncbi:serine/threonine transporter [Legionella sp. CNM-4043-24]|uniref:serine/threonine transporter n=1 Tax=Legionella sp. CNM-4043-24 TaxID=3421646 RepID=UPI00403ADB94